MKNLIRISVLFVVCMLMLSNCKKYPENTLWFKNPEKVYPIIGYITKYSVNNIDSLSLLNAYFTNLTCSTKEFTNAYFSTSVSHSRIDCSVIFTGNCGLSSPISYNFSKDKKIFLLV